MVPRVRPVGRGVARPRCDRSVDGLPQGARDAVRAPDGRALRPVVRDAWGGERRGSQAGDGDRGLLPRAREALVRDGLKPGRRPGYAVLRMSDAPLDPEKIGTFAEDERAQAAAFARRRWVRWLWRQALYGVAFVGVYVSGLSRSMSTQATDTQAVWNIAAV